MLLQRNILLTVDRWVVGIVCIVSTLYNVPRWFEYRPQTQTLNDTNVTMLVAASTWLVTDPIYLRVYYSWLYLPVMCIVPLVALSTINASLVLAVRRSRADRKRMNVRQYRENNVTLMLVTVVAVFIVCQVRLTLYLTRSDNVHYFLHRTTCQLSQNAQTSSNILPTIAAIILIFLKRTTQAGAADSECMGVKYR